MPFSPLLFFYGSQRHMPAVVFFKTPKSSSQKSYTIVQALFNEQTLAMAQMQLLLRYSAMNRGKMYFPSHNVVNVVRESRLVVILQD
ncbi:MAG: hypothetical protein J0652_11165 [Desulfobulbaceae bacterium]|nr:hypothetical protein [Desulfobulbaceae bacterium]